MRIGTMLSRPRRRWSTMAAAALASLLSAGVLFAAPAPASANPGDPAGNAGLQNRETQRCLDSDGGGGVWTEGCNYSIYERFDWYQTPYAGWYNIVDHQTGRCLDSNYNGNVYTSPCNWNNTYQAWQSTSHSLGNTFQNLQTKRCLDSNYNGNVYTSSCNWNNTYENWYYFLAG